MAEEFQESEVIFSEYDGCEGNNGYRFPGDLNSPELRKNSKPRRKKLRTKRNNNNTSPPSLPVNIPENISWFQCVDSNHLAYDDDDDGGDGEMEPPHVIIGRRVAGKEMAFSVCTGNGRTLKGRDLSEVRNSILRMTGFLET